MKLKRFFCTLLLTLMAAASMLSAAEQDSSPRGYLALGDSIAFGYGLYDIPSDSYAALVAKELDAPLTNLAVNGMTSSGLLELLKGITPNSADYNTIADAALITVSIGSNDLLSVLSSTMSPYADLMNHAATLGSMPAEGAALIETALTSPAALAKFDTGVETYRANLPLLYARLRELNPDAQIVMTSFYNPYYGAAFGQFDFASLCDSYIVLMNEVLTMGAQSMDYTVADVYPAFNTVGMTCVDMNTFNLDPHPNVVGHRAFADAILNVTAKDAFSPAPAESTPVTEAPSSQGSAPEESSGPTKILVYAVCIGAAVLSFTITAIIFIRKNKENPHKNYRRF